MTKKGKTKHPFKLAGARRKRMALFAEKKRQHRDQWSLPCLI
jgi:hypothetical protein